jgi:hypothetical protein
MSIGATLGRSLPPRARKARDSPLPLPGERGRHQMLALLRRLVGAWATHVQRWWLYRLIVRAVRLARRYASAVVVVALLGALTAGVWASVDQFKDQRRASTSTQAAPSTQGASPGRLPAPGQPTTLTRSATEDRAGRAELVDEQWTATSGSRSVAAPLSTAGHLATRIGAALVGVLRLALNSWPLLLAVPPVLVAFRVRRWLRERRLLDITQPVLAVRENVNLEEERVSAEALDEPEADIESTDSLGPSDAEQDLVERPLAAGDSSGSCVSAPAAGPDPVHSGAVDPDQPAPGQQHTFYEPQAADGSRYDSADDETPGSSSWTPDETVPEQDARFAAPRVSIIGTTIWSPKKETGAPTQPQSDGTAATITASSASRGVPAATAQQPSVSRARERERERQKALHHRSPAVRVARPDSLPTTSAPTGMAALAAELEALREQNVRLQQRLVALEESPGTTAEHAGSRRTGRGTA